MKNRESTTDYNTIPIGYYHNAMLNGPSIQRFWHRKKFEKVANLIPDSSRVLDIGCGPGSFAFVLSSIRPSCTIFGIDIAKGQIDFAEKNILPIAKNSHFRIFDGNNIPFDDSSYDVVTLIEVIEHLSLKTAGRLLEEAYRILRPSGKLIITTPNYASQWPVLEKILELLSPVKYGEQHISRFTKHSLCRVVEAERFTCEKIETLFVIAPYFAILNPTIGDLLLHSESQLGGGVGSLLVGIFTK